MTRCTLKTLGLSDEQAEGVLAEAAAVDEAHAAAMRQLRFDSAVRASLAAARARHPDAVKPLLADFLAEAELEGEDVGGLSEEIARLAEDPETGYLFHHAEMPEGGAIEPPVFTGVTPAASPDSLPGDGDAFLQGFAAI